MAYPLYKYTRQWWSHNDFAGGGGGGGEVVAAVFCQWGDKKGEEQNKGGGGRGICPFASFPDLPMPDVVGVEQQMREGKRINRHNNHHNLCWHQ